MTNNEVRRAVPNADITLRFDPASATPEALASFLAAAAKELTENLPNLQVVLGKIEMAQKISEELLRSRVEDLARVRAALAGIVKTWDRAELDVQIDKARAALEGR